MSDKNKVKITCDPYANKIEYKFFDAKSEEWNELDNRSPLKDSKFTNTSLQKVVYDVVEVLNKKYNPGTTGLNIVFEGTNEDYEQLENIVNSYFSDSGIELTRGKCYFLSAKEAKEKIENIFKNVSKKLENCPNKEVKELIDKYTETVRPTVPICVIGLYSAGKSAFINALLGIELLPSASDPTTAKTYKISLGNKNEIRFKWLKNKNNWISISLLFDVNTYQISSPETIELVRELNEIEACDTIERRMYRAIEIINKYDVEKNRNVEKGQEKLSISDLIEVELDRKAAGSGVLYYDNYDFVLYDTPGSNSASNEDHTEVLKKAMEGQTNGLPIYITTPDAMDNNDNMNLMNILKELGGALDKDNLMIVVNKADEKGKKTLSEKKNSYSERCISKLNPAGTYFVSSPVGIGCKKLLSGNTLTDEDGQLVPNFIDDDYEYTFYNNIRNFEDDKAKMFLQLYTYNIVPKKQFDDYINLPMGEKYFAYRNSGLHAIESAIIDFSDKYALYNKCKNASDYLSKAIELLDESMTIAEKEKEELSQELELKMDIKHMVVLNELKSVCNKQKSQFMRDYSNSLNVCINNEYANVESEIQKELKDISDKCLKDYWKKEKIFRWKETVQEATAREITELLIRKTESSCKEVKKATKSILMALEKSLKDELASKIVNSENLTEDQRRMLEQKIQDLSLNYNTAPKIDWSEVYFLWLFFDVNRAKETFIKKYEDIIAKFNDDIKEQASENVDNFVSNVKNSFNDLIQNYNPDICELNNELKKLQNEILNLQEQKKEIKDIQVEVKALICSKTTNGD